MVAEKNEKVQVVNDLVEEASTSDSATTKPVKELKFGFLHINPDEKIHRTLPLRIVNLIAFGGSIGTALFITIGNPLMMGGPLSLVLAYWFWTIVMVILNTCVGEMVSYLPVVSPFTTLAGRCVDEALQFSSCWNFYLMESLYIPFEIVAVNGMIHFWRDDYSAGITLGVQIVLYGIINIFAVRIYGESEFWLAIGKIVLAIGLLFFTLITMCGGNPQHDAFGFRYWQVEGGPMVSYLGGDGSGGRFRGLVSCLVAAAFCVVGPEYISMVASEAANPRVTMPRAFKTILYRLVIFYVLGSLSVSVLVAYNDPTLVNAPAAGAAKSPYVVAMKNLQIKALPDIVNALIITSAFSAGNSYVYCSSRVLYSMAKQGFAPKIFSYCTKSGVPIFGVMMGMCFALLSLLQLGSNSATVLSYLVSICTGSQVLNYAFMGVTYIGFYRACQAQGIDRTAFKFKAWFQPYGIYFSLTCLCVMVGILGYTNFLPGMFSVSDFLFSYIMVFVNLILIAFWKIFKRTKRVNPAEADLVTGLEEIEEHEYEYYAKLNVSPDDYKPSLKNKILGWIF
ncbi:general amino acid permease Agp2p [[Candida] jaroonii]|uniref:General amino acid permease Agp2p n=1 Tax=[Candida] jaroonii TaxID=467808 RepID=A0ACA9YFV3_9ASCO|nr:general amino acid permease Agp2p [[Candida] jaroonii]